MICSFCTVNKFLSNRQLKWELLKYEVLKFTINYTKQIAKEKRQQRTIPENQLKILEKNLDEDDNLSRYNNIKNELDAIYDNMTEGICIRSKCNWYKHSKKIIFFFNLEKQHGAQKLSLMIRKLQTRHIFYNVKSNSMKLFSKNTKKKP